MHGVWRPGGRLVLWGEDSTLPATPPRRPGRPPRERPHPYACGHQTLVDMLGEPAAKAVTGSVALTLPTRAAAPVDSPELVRADPPGTGHTPVALARWRVATLEYDADQALAVLAALTADATGGTRGGTLRQLGELAAFATELVRRGRVLPGASVEPDGARAVWRPVLTGGDAAWARHLAAALPPAVRAADPETPLPTLVADALDALTDAAARAALDGVRLVPAGRSSGQDAAVHGWLRALTGQQRVIRASAAALTALTRELDDWQRDAAGSPVRACFRLVEPPADADPTEDRGNGPEPDGGAGWRVEFALQPADEPGVLADAERIWVTGDVPEPLAGRVTAPRETLLTELGRASRLWPELTDALRTATPTGLDLDTEGAHRFLRDGAPVLHAAGFGVLLPGWWRKPGARLGARLRAGTPTAPGAVASRSALGQDSLVDYRWEVALGDQPLTEEELRSLAALKTPLVRLRGQWVELDPSRLKAGLKLLGSRGRMTVTDLLHLALAGRDDPDALPVTAVTAEGALGDLLSGRVDRHLAPVEPSPEFVGTLRPYQQRGLAWLSFLESLKLGGILADDMGLGKCVAGTILIQLNGKLIPAEEVWARYAGPAASDGEGEWAEPTEPLTINALAGGPFPGPMVAAPVRRLYRQHVSEKLRRVRLDDGSEVVVTRRHKLLGVNGWTNRIEVGERLCVPARLPWTGEPVDPDLTTLLAWQISEGHERSGGHLQITQTDVTVLERVRRAARRLAESTGVGLNSLVIRSTDRAHILNANSVAYQRYLEERGYRWGRLSAGKAIPDFVVAADAATLRLFLREFFSAEGCVNVKMGNVEIASASPVVMRQLSAMLRRFGVWLRFTLKHKMATNGTRIKRPYQVGLIGGPSLRLFREHVGFSDPVKQAKLEAVCDRPCNTNVEGVPTADLLGYAKRSSGLPARHFGVGTVYVAGTQEASRSTVAAAIAGLDRIIDGTAAREYAELPRTRWTERTNQAYRELDVLGMADVRDALARRSGSEVHFARVVAVEDVDHTGWVYDFEVPEHHNYVAGGMLCHNTAQMLALMARDVAVETGPTLLICPMSLVGNWQREAAKFTPGLRLHVHHGAERARGAAFAAAVRDADVVVTTYSIAARDAAALAAVDWHRIVVDEAQAIKNAATRQAEAVRSLPARHRVAMTGTPVENRLADLWSIMEFANPGLLGAAPAFKKSYAEPIERHGDAAAAERLRRITGPFVLRRLKTDASIISDLPEKLDMPVVCNLTAEQASLYQAVLDDMLDRIERSEGIERRGLVLATMTKLKQVCNHPAQLLRDGSALAGRSGKLARLEEIVEEVLAVGEKALLFTQYAEFGAMLRAHLSARTGREVLFLHGGVGKAARDEMVTRFQAGMDGDGSSSHAGPPLFVLSLKAGGTGLTLTAANHVVHVDRWWNPAVEDQATDRAFRIGQRRAVQVRTFVCAGTVEEKIAAMVADKRGLATRVVGTGEQWLTELSTGQLRELFALEAGAVVE